MAKELFKILKDQDIEVRSILHISIDILETEKNLGTRLTKQEILDVLEENGVSELEDNSVFSIVSRFRLWQITYQHSQQAFFYQRLVFAE